MIFYVCAFSVISFLFFSLNRVALNEDNLSWMKRSFLRVLYQVTYYSRFPQIACNFFDVFSQKQAICGNYDIFGQPNLLPFCLYLVNFRSFLTFLAVLYYFLVTFSMF